MFPDNSQILIVDDSRAIRELLRQQLKILGFSHILEASNGKEALSLLDQVTQSGAPVDLIISDWNMPEMNGIDFLLSLKNSTLYRKVSFLMITSESEAENVIKAIVLGVSDFIVKPFDEAQLEQKLSAIWKRFH